MRDFFQVQSSKLSVCIANLRDNLFYITLAEKVQSQPFRKGLFCVLTFPVEKVVWDASESTNFKKLLHQAAEAVFEESNCVSFAETSLTK